MSKPSEPPIPTSPTPGKDPPHSSEAFPNLPSQPTDNPSTSKTNNASASSKPRERPPTIITQPPSRSTTFHPQPSNSTSIGLFPQIQTQHPPPHEEISRPASFAPFFTLVTDIKESENETGTYHPNRIHYIFSDDDENTDVLSSALLRTLSLPSSSQHAIQTSDPGLENSNSNPPPTTTTSSSSSSAPRNKKLEREKEREERIIIVDINNTANNSLSVKKISSLSKDWQVLSASIDNAPTWDGAVAEDAGAGGLMLRIEGVGIPSSSTITDSFTSSHKTKMKDAGGGGREGKSISSSESKSSAFPEQELHSLLESFDRKMMVLRRVVSQHQDLNPLLDLGLVDGEGEGGVAGEGLDVRGEEGEKNSTAGAGGGDAVS